MKKFLPMVVFVVVVAAIVIIGIKANKNNNPGNNQAANSTVAGSVTSGKVKGASTDTSGIDPVALAKFLTSKGAVFYGAYWCPHCQDQKKLFGDAMQYITYVECDPKGENAQPDKCTAAGVEGYPTWTINGQKVSGTQTLSQLAQLSGFGG